MTNIYFPDEEVTVNDLYFVCYMVERIARQLKQPNKYVVNTLGKQALREKLSLANVLHCDNPDAVAYDWIEAYGLQPGEYDVSCDEILHIIPYRIISHRTFYHIISVRYSPTTVHDKIQPFLRHRRE